MTQGSIIVAYAVLDELSPATLTCLSKSEIQRGNQFNAILRRQQYLCGHALLRAVLEQYTGDAAASHRLSKNEKGKPVCVDGPAVSIAHSGKMVVCAATNIGEIGVDIEVPGRRRDIQAIADNYFSENEGEWLATQADDRFYMLWVLKEAWLKATGSGLAGGLDSLGCIVTPPHIVTRIADHEPKALSLYAVESAMIGLATTEATHDAAIINRWDPGSGRFVANSGVRLIATTTQPIRQA